MMEKRLRNIITQAKLSLLLLQENKRLSNLLLDLLRTIFPILKLEVLYLNSCKDRIMMICQSDLKPTMIRLIQIQDTSKLEIKCIK